MSYFEVCTYMYIIRVYKKTSYEIKLHWMYLVVNCFLLLNFPLNIFLFFDWIALGTKWRMDYKEIGVELIKLHKKYRI